MVLSQSKTVIDTNAILNHIQKTQNIIQQIQNEFNYEQDECLIILGPSRTGKTTLFLMLQGIVKLEIAKMGKYVIREVQNDPNIIQSRYPRIDHEDNNNLSNNKISEQNQSKTEDPEYYVVQLQNGKKLLVWDTPGFGDSKGITQDIKNGYSIERLFHSFKKIKIIFAIPFQAFELLNKIADEALTQLLKSFKNFNEIQQDISFVITKMIQDYDTSQEFQEHQLQNNILNKQMDPQLKSLYQTIANTKNLIIMKSPTTTHPDASEYYSDFKKQMIQMIQEAKSIGQPQTLIEISEENKEHLKKFKIEIEKQLIQSIEDIEQQIKTTYNQKMGQNIKQHPINPLFKKQDRDQILAKAYNGFNNSSSEQQEQNKTSQTLTLNPVEEPPQNKIEEKANKQKILKVQYQDLLQELKHTIFIHDEIKLKKSIIDSISVIDSITPVLTNTFKNIANLQKLDEVVMLISFFNQMESSISLKLVENQQIKSRLVKVMETLIQAYKEKINSFLLDMILVYQEKWEQSFNKELEQPIQALNKTIKFINCIEAKQNYKQRIKAVSDLTSEYTYMEPNQVKQLVCLQEKFNNNFELQDKHLSDIFKNTRNKFKNISEDKTIVLSRNEFYGERELLNINEIEVEVDSTETVIQQDEKDETMNQAQKIKQQSQQIKMKREIQELQKEKNNQKQILKEKQIELDKTKEDYRILKVKYDQQNQIQLQQTQKEEERKLLLKNDQSNNKKKDCCTLI